MQPKNLTFRNTIRCSLTSSVYPSARQTSAPSMRPPRAQQGPYPRLTLDKHSAPWCEPSWWLPCYAEPGVSMLAVETTPRRPDCNSPSVQIPGSRATAQTERHFSLRTSPRPLIRACKTLMGKCCPPAICSSGADTRRCPEIRLGKSVHKTSWSLLAAKKVRIKIFNFRAELPRRVSGCRGRGLWPGEGVLIRSPCGQVATCYIVKYLRHGPFLPVTHTSVPTKIMQL